MAAKINHRDLLSVRGEGHDSACSSTTSPHSLAAVEEGQVGAKIESPNMLGSAKFKETKSKYAGLLAASALQEQDSAYLAVRAFTLPFAFLQGYLEKEVEECWDQIYSAILAGDDAGVPELMQEFKEKASVCLEMAQRRKFLAGLARRRPRDLRVFLQYLTLGWTSVQQYPRDTSQWRGLLDLERFEDWARSIVMAQDSKICRWLAFITSDEMVDINGQEKRRVDPRKLIGVLATAGGLSASILFGTPFVILASEVLPRWANIIIVVVWVLLLLLFLVGWGVNSSSLFLLVLGYTTMLANVNMGGSK